MAQDTVAAGAPPATLTDRIEVMFSRDKAWATILVVALWLMVFFVILAVRGFIKDPAIELVCWGAAALLLLFNTAAFGARLPRGARQGRADRSSS